MCYTYEVSRDAFIIGVVSSLILFFKDDPGSSKAKNNDYKIVALFFMFISLMQFYDAVFWKNPPIDEEKKKINEKYTKIAMYINHLQPLVLAGLIYYYKGSISSFSKKLLIVYTLVMLLYNHNASKKIKYTEITEQSSPSLYWEWNALDGASILYGIYIFLFIILFMKDLGGNVGKLGVILTILTYVYSHFKYKKKNSIGRFWCYFAAFCPLIFFFLYLN
jgi:hypothetical protein